MLLLLLLAACGPEGDADPPAHCALAEGYAVSTADGATVHLHRHPAPGPPVLVVHGISANHRCWDLSADRSLAVALNEAGYDAWLLDLRGHGLAAADAAGDPQRGGWSIEDYGRYDLPAAIDFVRARTGYAQVGYVGHSLGGMVAAIYNAIHGDDALAALVIVASPVDFADPDPLVQLAGRAIAASALTPTVPTPLIGRSVAGMRELPFAADDLLWAADNMSDDAQAALLRTVASPLTRAELAQLQQFLRDGSFPYADALPSLQAPIRVIAGRADRIAPADRVRPFFERAGSAEKSWILAGRANGFRYDYGHLDLAIGDGARAEIYPLVRGWMDQHLAPLARADVTSPASADPPPRAPLSAPRASPADPAPPPPGTAAR